LAPLSIGTICGDQLQCAYHGWRFGADGRCQAIPSLGEADRIPGRANPTAAWGVQERFGLVWLAPEEPRCPIPDFREWETEGFDQIWTTIVSTTVGAGQLVDNFLDASHFPFVHAGTFGDAKASVVVDDGIVREGWLVRTEFSTWYRNSDDPLVATGEHQAVQPQDLLKQGGASMTVYLRLFFPVTGATLSILFACQPETAQRSRIYKLVARDDLAGDPRRRAQTVADEDLILREDLAVLERYSAMELHLDPRVEVHTKSDRLSLAWRRVLAEWATEYCGAQAGASSQVTPA
jgi:vanillate O-demethylase monooxygenase subunit